MARIKWRSMVRGEEYGGGRSMAKGVEYGEGEKSVERSVGSGWCREKRWRRRVRGGVGGGECGKGV